MSTSKPVRDADTVATIIPFRPSGSGIAPSVSVHHAEAPPPWATNIAQLAPEQLSLFGEDLDR